MAEGQGPGDVPSLHHKKKEKEKKRKTLHQSQELDPEEKRAELQQRQQLEVESEDHAHYNGKCDEIVEGELHGSEKKRKKKKREGETLVALSSASPAMEERQEEVLEPSEDGHKKKKKKKSIGGNGGEAPVIAEAMELEGDSGKNGQARKKRQRRLREGEDEEAAAASSSGRFTVSMAVAGSIVDNAQSFSLASRLAGQIARAAAIFRIDEIVVFDDGEEGSRVPKWSEDTPETSGTFLTRILKYMETPQYLRHALVPRHSSLQFAGGLPPLDVPHQARKHEWIPYREGAVTTKPPPSGGGSCVNVGLYEDVVIRQKLGPGTRVTVKMGATRPEPGTVRILDAVPKSEPREKEGLYWGYTVRHASCLSAVFSDCPFPGGYDYAIGTSEHGQKVRAAELTVPKFKHILIVFGGVAGLEESKELDKTIKVGDVRHLFDIYLNTCPGQGSRTIRTEEAVLISLQYLQDPLMRALGLPFAAW